MIKRLAYVIFFVVSSIPAFSQTLGSRPIPNDWFLLDPEMDSVQGVSAERAYQTVLKDKPSRTVIVAVIDSGVDIEHEDLQNVIWKNEAEIPDNGIDDDKNGYIDDVFGWNFIGGANGNVDADTYELTREYIRLKAIYENVVENKLNKKQKTEYQQYLKVADKFTKLKAKNEQQYKLYNGIYTNMASSIDTLKSLLHVDTITLDVLKSFETREPGLLFAKGFLNS